MYVSSFDEFCRRLLSVLVIRREWERSGSWVGLFGGGGNINEGLERSMSRRRAIEEC
jgi:hypothetical protein